MTLETKSGIRTPRKRDWTPSQETRKKLFIRMRVKENPESYATTRAKRLAEVKSFMEKGICGACKGEKVIDCVCPAKDQCGVCDEKTRKRVCLGCSGTGKYPPKAKRGGI